MKDIASHFFDNLFISIDLFSWHFSRLDWWNCVDWWCWHSVVIDWWESHLRFAAWSCYAHSIWQTIKLNRFHKPFLVCHSIRWMCLVRKCYHRHFICMNQVHGHSCETVIFFNSRLLYGKWPQKLSWKRSKHSEKRFKYSKTNGISIEIFSLKYGPYDLPATVIDSLEEYPICDCGILCPPFNLHFRTCQILIRTNSLIQSNRAPIYADSVYCSDYCRSLYQKLYADEWK